MKVGQADLKVKTTEKTISKQEVKGKKVSVKKVVTTEEKKTVKKAEAEKESSAVKISDEAKIKASEAQKLRDSLKDIRKRQKPGIYFINGLSLFSSSDKSGGLEKMSKHIKHSEVFAWDDEDKIIDEIKKKSADRPIVLVGHSLGGDTAVSIANKLNTLEHGFRKVDLLVTLDSVGRNNDLIPQNVGKNINFIGDPESYFSDGPNIARNTKSTTVINELRGEGHRELDDTPDIQFVVFDEIRGIVAEKKSLGTASK